MTNKNVSKIWVIAALAIASTAPARAADFVAGLVPDRRPEGAPVKAETPVTGPALSQRLHGIQGTPPGNLASIAATGAWYVPLRHPGATPPYDIRSWHNPATSSPSASSPR